MKTITLDGVNYAFMQCGTCSVWHAFPKLIYDTSQAEGGFWHCPNGHSRGFNKGQDEIDRENIRRERDRLKQDAARLADEITAEKTRANEAERKYLQVKRRAASGVCPCCNRTFLNVQRHMKTKHPNVVPIDQKTA